MKLSKSTNMHDQLEKLKESLTALVAICTVVTVFSLIGAKSLWSQASYQSHVLSARHKAVAQLKSNITAANQLVTEYNQVFENSGSVNILGGKNDSSQTAVPPDGDNARLVLDALPSSYDFPALVTSLSKILTSDQIQNPSVSGQDQSTTVSSDPVATPVATAISVPIGGTSDYAGVQRLLRDLQRSTRPYDITSLQIAGSQTNMTFSLTMNTYFQPPKSLDPTAKVINK